MKWVENVRNGMSRDCLEVVLKKKNDFLTFLYLSLPNSFNGQTHKQRLGNSYIDIFGYIKIGMLLLKKCKPIVALKIRTVNHRFLHNFPIRKQTRS